MEQYSPSFVTEDADDVLETATNLSSIISCSHDDRDAVDYPSLNAGPSLLRSKFSDDEASGNKYVASSPVEDLRDILSRKNKRHRNRSSRSGYRDRKTSRHSSGRSHDEKNKFRSKRSHSKRSRSKRSRSKRSRSKRSRSRRRSRSRSRDKRSRDRSRSKCKSHSHHQKDNLDIEIRIKNQSSSLKHRSYTEEKKQPKCESTITKLHSKYAKEHLDHQKALEEFKKTFESKYDVSVGSIVKEILSTNSSSEIKRLLKVDIDTVGRSKPKSKSSKHSSSKRLHEKCMHCPELFDTSSPPGLCIKCGLPRDADSYNHNPRSGSNCFQNPPAGMPPLNPVLYNYASFNPYSYPMMTMPQPPPGIMPHLPPGVLGTIPPGPMPSILPAYVPNSVQGVYNPSVVPYNSPSFPEHVQALPSVKGHTLVKANHVPSSYNYASTISENYDHLQTKQKKLNLVQVKDFHRNSKSVHLEVLTDVPDTHPTISSSSNVKSESSENKKDPEKHLHCKKQKQPSSNMLANILADHIVADSENKKPDSQSFDYQGTIKNSSNRSTVHDAKPQHRLALLDTPDNQASSSSSRSPSEILKTLVCNTLLGN